MNFIFWTILVVEVESIATLFGFLMKVFLLITRGCCGYFATTVLVSIVDCE